MKNRFLLIVTMALSTLAIAEDAPPRAIKVAEPTVQKLSPAAEQALSRSKQFRVSGGEPDQRATVVLLAQETKDEMLKFTGENGEWKIPISIRLHGKPGDPLPTRSVVMQLLEVAGITEIGIDTHLSRGVERDRFKRAVTAALIYARALGKNPEGNAEHPMVVPPWLSDGLLEATAWRNNQTDQHLYEALFIRGGIFKIEDLFTTGEAAFEDMDAATRAAFRVSSGALVMALLEQPHGNEGFRAFLEEVAGYEGEMPALLRKHFPELNLSGNSLAKWWQLQLANKGGLNLATDIYTIQQTETALGEALTLNFRTPEGIIQRKALSAWPELATLKEPERAAAVRLAQDALVRLSYRCFPSYRSLLIEYQSVLISISRNNTKDVAARLAKLDETRTTMQARAVRARDYLDWFEITRARETSGVFDDYQRLKDRLKSNPTNRKDHISGYLERMDRLFYREVKKESMGMLPPP